MLTDPAGRADAVATGLPVVVSELPRPLMAQAAAAVYGRPADRLTMHAVTGTNGKTTTTFLLDAALRATGHHVGTVGTIGFLLDGEPLPASRTTVTTPESPDLQALLAHLLEAGADSVVMEVSSHALVLGRADAITFDVAAFTNLGRDHLDFHGDEESYFEAKAQLFTPERTRQVVLSVDDPAGRRLLTQVRRTPELTVRTVSLSDPGADHRCSTPGRAPTAARPPPSASTAGGWTSGCRCRATSTSATPSPRWPWSPSPAATWRPPLPGSRTSSSRVGCSRSRWAPAPPPWSSTSRTPRRP